MARPFERVTFSDAAMIAGCRRAAYGMRASEPPEFELVYASSNSAACAIRRNSSSSGISRASSPRDVAQDAHGDDGLADKHASAVEEGASRRPAARASGRLAMAVDDVEHRLAGAQKRRVEGGRVARLHAERRGVDDDVRARDGLPRRGVAAELEAHLLVHLGKAQVPFFEGGHVHHPSDHRPQLVGVGAHDVAGLLLVAADENHLGRSRLSHGMQDGKGGRPRAADDDGRAAKIDAGRSK